MDEKGFRPSEGNCIISEEVIATIASTAALEIPGVAGMAQRPDIRGIVAAGAASRSVKVISNESETVVDVYIQMRLGVRIPEVAEQVQRSVKVAVQSMTGKPVTKVNIHVAGVVLDDEKKTAKA